MTQATPPSSPLRIGMLGLGRAGVAMLPALQSHPHVRLVAAADLSARARAQFTQDFGLPAHDNPQALCEDPDIDVIYIATPHQFHVEHCRLAAQHGKHIVVEKPLALSLAECDAIIEAVERAGVCLTVGHTASFNPSVGAARALIRGGTLGRLRLLNFSAYTSFLYRPRRPEELDTAKGGGVLFNQAPHQVDTARLLGGGMVASVRATAGVWDAARRTEGAYAALLQFEDGAAASLVYSGYDHFDSGEFRVSTQDERSLTLGSHAVARRALKKATTPAEEAAMLGEMGYGGSAMRKTLSPDMFQVELGLAILSCERADLRLVADGIMVYDDDGKRALPVSYPNGVPGRGNVFDELWQALQSGTSPLHDARWGKATIEVCLAIQQSARENREVRLQYQCPLRD